MNLSADWSDLLRVVVVGSCAYLALVVLLRGYGKRTLSKINAFDFVVTIALGSILATILLSKSVSLLEGVTALVVVLASALRAERIAPDEVMQALRNHGFQQLQEVRSVILEPDGTLSVIGRDTPAA
ncbi:DUF421 domain-containing protein [Lysobacter sp. H21R4]|uniref:DUF421 domain-containing protein n=1 Tax=Lysobacter sp. H21R4 TaxID=2781021 RepID=UPI001887DD12|nr:YetF domain-containing protein [Lysobacter sp. H21R4]QOY63008.1 DUF421 domain-containing protein [Lysobacter sp. H21R4]